MRIIFAISCLIIVYSFLNKPMPVTGTNYYVANSGNDANDGLSPATAWQHISKVNSSTFAAGDSILLKRGDSWNEQLKFPSSGTLSSPIIIAAYGAGNKPLITGFQTLSGFVNTSGNIWTVTATNSVLNQNTVLVNGLIKAKGRFPNTGYLTFTSYTDSSLTSASFTGSYVGMEVVVKSSVFTIDVAKVTSQVGTKIYFTPKLTYTPNVGGNGCFFQNDSTLLDQQNEWSYDSTTKRFQINSLTDPSGNVQISSIDTIISLSQKNYITFDNLSITGGNKALFQLDTSNYVTIKNSSLNNSFIGINAQKCIKTIVQNDSVQNSLSNAMYMRGLDPYHSSVNTCDSSYIYNNYVKNSGLFAGMGANAQGRYCGIYNVGYGSNISYNRVDSTGYIGIFFFAPNDTCYRNYVSNSCFTLLDGAGIYTLGSEIPNFSNGELIRSNIVVNSIGSTAGTNITSYAADIYLDSYSKRVTIDSNFGYNGLNSAFLFNSADSNIVRNNTFINATTYVFLYGGGNSDVSATGNNIKNNIFYSSSSTAQLIGRLFGGTNVGTIDSNYYSRPLNENNTFLYNSTNYNLAGWQAITGKDQHSHGSPVGIDPASPLIVYNPTLSDSIIAFSGDKKTMDGTIHSGGITLAPFTGEILFNIQPLRQYQYKHYL